MRLFLGVALTGPVANTLEHVSGAIKETSPAWREEKWVPRENLHITVRFLGDVPDDEAPALRALMAEVTSQHPTHDITLNSVIARPRTRSARMLWAAFDGAIGTTAALADALSKSLASAGYGRPEHPFAPHATLVRARRPREISADALDAARAVLDASSLQDRTMSVTGVTLFASTLTPHGPQYDSLGVATLA